MVPIKLIFYRKERNSIEYLELENRYKELWSIANNMTRQLRKIDDELNTFWKNIEVDEFLKESLDTMMERASEGYMSFINWNYKNDKG